MIKKILISVIGLILILSFVIAEPGKSGKFALPENAKEIAPGVYSLGHSLHDGKLVEGMAYVHYKEGKAKGGNARAGGSDSSSCYGFMAKGAKWKKIENWIVNPANSRGLDSAFVFDNLAFDIGKWENAAGKNILGGGSLTSDLLAADTINPDNQNEVYFADVSDSGAIAVTIVWGYFSGPIFARELVEWDQVYDDVDFDWSLNGEANKMDFENIATHELGHSFGLADLYTLSCSAQTMYGYASDGETNKRTLELGDITGIKKLYA